LTSLRDIHYFEFTVNQNLARIERQLKRYGITQDQVGAACEPTPVTRTMVCKVFRGRAKSAKVVATAERLILAAKLAELSEPRAS
jgi:hypothetical protein